MVVIGASFENEFRQISRKKRQIYVHFFNQIRTFLFWWVLSSRPYSGHSLASQVPKCVHCSYFYFIKFHTIPFQSTKLCPILIFHSALYSSSVSRSKKKIMILNVHKVFKKQWNRMVLIRKNAIDNRIHGTVPLEITP